MDWNEITPTLRHANFYDARPGESFGPRYIPDWQILLVQQGTGVVRVGSEWQEIEGGNAVWYGPNDRHEVRSSITQPLRLMGLHFVFHDKDKQRMKTQKGHGQLVPYEEANCAYHSPICLPPYVVTLVPQSRMPSDCESLILSYIAAPQGRYLEKRGLLLLIFESWRESSQKAVSPTELPLHYKAIQQAQTDVLNNLVLPPTMHELASRAGLSTSHFSHLFRQISGKSLQGFILEQRLLLSRRLLTAGQKNIAEVATSVGFTDPFYFSRRFHQAFGMPPSEFRRQYALQ